MRLVRDVETRSEISVVDVGPCRYAADPSTEVLMVGWCVDDAPPRIAILVGGCDGRAAVERRVREGGGVVATYDDYLRDVAACDVIVSHNQAFEVAIEDYLMRDVSALRNQKFQTCTASRARRLSLPGSLEDACKVLRTPHQKMMDGHTQMMMCAQPRPAWTNRQAGPKWFDDADRLAKVALYCLADIEAERDLDRFLPELSPTERARWLQTERVNRRGVPLDARLIDAMSAVVAREQAETLTKVAQIPGGADLSLTDPAAIRRFCQGRGLWLDDLRKETVAEALASHYDGVRPLDPAIVAVLEARREVGGKTSASKLPRMRGRLLSDSRARDLTIYHGAHTARTTGDGINLLNLPRPYKKFDQTFVIDALLRGDIETIRREHKVSGSVAVSAALRGVIVPGAGRKLVIGDYTSIEPCFYFTLARQWDAVQILGNNGDIYCEVASTIYGRQIHPEHDKTERQVGKVVVLAAAYGMGLKKFSAVVDTTPDITLSDEMKEQAHGAYRRRFPGIPQAWNGLEQAAKSAIRDPGSFYEYNSVQYVFDGYWLVCLLPSNRPFYYPNARLLPGKYDEEIIYEGWQRIDGRPAGWGDVRTWGGSLLENVTQASCRDVMEEDQETLEAMGWEAYLTVYDEIVMAAPQETPNAWPAMKAVMERDRDWMPGMPVRAKGFEAMRYIKQ